MPIAHAVVGIGVSEVAPALLDPKRVLVGNGEFLESTVQVFHPHGRVGEGWVAWKGSGVWLLKPGHGVVVCSV